MPKTTLSESESPPRTVVRRPRRTQAERRETARKRILEAAARVIRMRGYDGLSTEEVSQLAGVSRGALRHHFPTENDLVVSTLRHLNEDMLARSWSRVERARGEADVLELLIEDAFDFFLGDYFFINLAITMSDERNGDLHIGARRISREGRFTIEKSWIERMEAANFPLQVASDVVALTSSIVRGFAIRRLIVDNRAEFDNLIGTWREMVRLYVSARLKADRRHEPA